MASRKGGHNAHGREETNLDRLFGALEGLVYSLKA